VATLLGRHRGWIRTRDHVLGTKPGPVARVDPREHCFPMIPAGAAALDLIEWSPETAAKQIETL